MLSQKARTLRCALQVSVAGLAALTLAACSSGASTSPSAGGGGDAAPAKLRVLVSPVYYEPLYVAEEQGLFEEANLDVTLVEGGAATEAIPQLLNGAVDLAMTSGTPVITAVDAGIPVKIVLGANNADPAVTTSGMLVKGDSPIKSYADLQGKTIGVQGLKSTPNLATLLAAKDAGVDPNSVKVVQIPLANINAAVDDGTIDVGYPVGIFWNQGTESGLRGIGSPTSDALAYGPNVVYAASDKYIADNADTIQRFNTVMAEATKLAQENDFKLVREIQLERTNQPEEFVKNTPISPYSTDIHAEGVNRMIEGMHEFGWIENELAFDDVVAPLAPVAK